MAPTVKVCAHTYLAIAAERFPAIVKVLPIKGLGERFFNITVPALSSNVSCTMQRIVCFMPPQIDTHHCMKNFSGHYDVFDLDDQAQVRFFREWIF